MNVLTSMNRKVIAMSTVTAVIPSINGVALVKDHETLDLDTLRERAYAELLRQAAVRMGRLPEQHLSVAPELSDAERQVIESMLDEAVVLPAPSAEACERYYKANHKKYMVDQALHIRHILFAVTPGVNVQALARKAEELLMMLMDKSTGAHVFAEQAAVFSNCPSGQQGGDLGWIAPSDCAPELAEFLFYQPEAEVAIGIQSRLVHTRFGLHIVDVLEKKPGRQLTFDEVHERVQTQLTMQSRATAWRQYMMLLVGDAEVVGVELDGADTPLVQA